MVAKPSIDSDIDVVACEIVAVGLELLGFVCTGMVVMLLGAV